MGIDTLKLSYPLQQSLAGYQWTQHARGWVPTKNYGTQGVCWWCERKHIDTGLKVRVKGVGADAHLIWEGSVPKLLGINGPAAPDRAFDVDDLVRSLTKAGLPDPTIRRVDVTDDQHDPAGDLRRAAVGWNPHARSRYVQAIYNDHETVWQHNKTRGVRVYDKHAESGEEWARDLTRIEYQIRGDWLNKYGLDRLYEDFAQNCDRALLPVVSDLLGRR